MYGFLVMALLGLAVLAVVKIFDRYVSVAPELKALVMVGLGIGGAWLLNVNYLAGLMLIGGRGGWIGITLTGVIVAGAAYFWDAILGFFSGLTRKHTDQAQTIEKGEHLRRVA
jgi:hypothetical protein